MFAVGVFVAAVPIAARFGVPAVMAWLGLIAALAAGLNVLLRARHPRQETFVTSTASNALRRQSAMTAATVVVWVVALAACSAYAYRWWVLRDSKSPLDVTYALLEARNIDHLLDPPRNFSASAPINGQEVVFTATAAHRTLIELRNRFSVESTHSELYFGTAGHNDRRFVEVPSGQTMRMFVGSSGAGEDNYLNPFVQRDATAADVQSLSDSEAGWVALARGASSEGVPGSELLFRRALRAEDLASSDSLLARFWQHITNGVLPANFGWVDLTADSICGDENTRVVKTLVGPLMSVEAAYYVNHQPKPERLGMIVFREGSSEALRTDTDDRRAIAAGRERIIDFEGFPLPPTRALVVPLRLVLTFPDPDKFEGNSEHVAAPLRDATARVRASRALRFGQFTIDGASVALSGHREFDSSAAFVFGRSAVLEKVVIDGDAHRVRSVPSKMPFASSGSPIGSCPYFAAFDGKQWRAGGVILRGRDDAAASGTDERPLRGFTGRVRVEEREREITILDRLYVVAVDAAGFETVLAARDPRLRDADGTTVRLERGDVLEVEFDSALPAAREFRLGATGYYTPLDRSSTSALSR
ncbi:MAG TPA: hypothetical protein VGF48_25760 [Thermoanaerobaculia bacterium]|jgi:hypothetical protein